jgi:hypothetical protein
VEELKGKRREEKERGRVSAVSCQLAMFERERRRLATSTHLDRLSVTPENVDSDDGLVEVRVCALNDVVVEMLLVAQRVHALEDELEERAQVLGRGRGDEDVGVAVCEGGSDGETESSRFATTSGGGEGDGGGEGLLGDGFDKSEDGFGLGEERTIGSRGRGRTYQLRVQTVLR